MSIDARSKRWRSFIVVSSNAFSPLSPTTEFRCEPKLALAAGVDGYDVVRRLLAEAKTHLSANGLLLVDVGHNRDLVEDAFPMLPFTWLATTAAEAGVFLLRAEELP